jgi:hypothetical protein
LRASAESLVAGLAGGVLGAFAGGVAGVHLHHLQRHTAEPAHTLSQWRAKPSAAACRPWWMWMALVWPGQRAAQADSKAVESAPPL